MRHYPLIKVIFTTSLTLSISELWVAQTPNFQRVLLSFRQSTTQNLDALAVVVLEIMKVKFDCFSNFRHFHTVTCSNFKLWEHVARFKSKCHTNFGWPNCCTLWDINFSTDVIFSSFSNFEHFGIKKSWDTKLWSRVAKVKTKSHWKFGCLNCCSLWDINFSAEVIFSCFPTVKESYPKGVMIINFEEELLRSRLSVIENLDGLTAVLFEILTFQLKSFLVVFLLLRSPTEKELR